MTDILGGALIMVGGGMLTVSSAALARAHRAAFDHARRILSAIPVAEETPPEMLQLLDQLP
jgi:hypothetical protein